MAKIKIKLALAVAPDGKWNCCGAGGMDEDDMMSLACDVVETGEARYWITAEVDTPDERIVNAQVEKAA